MQVHEVHHALLLLLLLLPECTCRSTCRSLLMEQQRLQHMWGSQGVLAPGYTVWYLRSRSESQAGLHQW